MRASQLKFKKAHAIFMNNTKSNQKDFLYSIGVDMTLQIPKEENQQSLSKAATPGNGWLSGKTLGLLLSLLNVPSPTW